MRSRECGISVRAMIMTFFEIPLSIRIRSPSFIAARVSLFLRLFIGLLMGKRYHRRFREANLGVTKTRS
jgi:hypothetical protein